MLSNKKPHLITKDSTFTQSKKPTWIRLLETLISKKANQEINKVINKNVTAMNEAPLRPIKRPNNVINKNDNKGKYITAKYILT